MDLWFFLAFLGTCLYAGVTFIDKYIVESVLDDFRGIVGLSSLIALVVGLIALLTTSLHPIPLRDGVLLMSAGGLIVVSTYVYFYVITKDHVSYVTVFFQLIPIFVIFLAHTILGESLSGLQIIGSLLVIVGGIAIVFADKNTEGFTWKIKPSTLWLMVVYDVLWALAAICIKLAGSQVEFGHVLVFENLGMGVVGLTITLVVVHYRKPFVTLITRSPLSTLFIVVGNEGILYLCAKLSMNYAYRVGSAGLVSIVESSQILIAMVVGFVLSMIRPRIFKENTNRQIIVRKLVYAVFMISGLALIR